MYICNDCKAVFNEPSGCPNFEMWGSASVLESVDGVCPECHSDDLNEAKICCICEKGFAEDELEHIDGGYYEDKEDRHICKACLKKISDEYDAWRLQHSVTEIGIIDALMEGQI